MPQAKEVAGQRMAALEASLRGAQEGGDETQRKLDAVLLRADGLQVRWALCACLYLRVRVSVFLCVWRRSCWVMLGWGLFLRVGGE